MMMHLSMGLAVMVMVEGEGEGVCCDSRGKLGSEQGRGTGCIIITHFVSRNLTRGI